jgi:hypothetical protein
MDEHAQQKGREEMERIHDVFSVADFLFSLLYVQKEDIPRNFREAKGMNSYLFRKRLGKQTKGKDR